jgi:LysR family transcriptional regulator (chromosome initiation inhibitor)
MKIDHLQLSAFLTVLREQSFEKAANILCVTPSAVSQRIRALEERLGKVLIIRESPCRPTVEGEKLYRHALQIELLERDLSLDLQFIETRSTQRIPIAVNADSLATWFMDAMKLFYEETGAFIEIVVDDENHTDTWLKQGRVLGAVTSQSKPVQGCRIEKLGEMIYLPMASPDFMRMHFSNGLTKEAFAKAPVLQFGVKDRIQNDFMKKIIGKTPKINPPCHIIPSSQGFQDAAVVGLGWGAAPSMLVEPFYKNGKLVNIAKGQDVKVPLYWQSWRLTSPTLDSLARTIRKAVRAAV